MTQYAHIPPEYALKAELQQAEFIFSMHIDSGVIKNEIRSMSQDQQRQYLLQR
jgi:hypothetical protein